ncbi:MAG: winged helix-turn-helix transcriptional regulator [Deltaproteobacteria bacterium]|nr:winged helix-turn-helix transcriptional regulator [Deltaproteobacteria bacterium]
MRVAPLSTRVLRVVARVAHGGADGATAGAACADALRAAVLQRAIPPGARLPPERELAAHLGFDRGTLRAGLQRLVAQGLLVQRQGRGTEVREFLEIGGLDLIAPLVRGAAAAAVASHVADLLLVRRHLAAAALEALCDRPASLSSCAAVQARVDAYAALVARRAALSSGAAAAHAAPIDDDVLAAADVAVLAAVVAATDSVVLRLAFNPVATVFAALPALRAAIVADAADSVPAYAALCAWLRAPDRQNSAAILALLSARDAATVARVAAAATTTRRSRPASRRRR